MEERNEDTTPPARTGPAKKIPCWVCGGDLTLNFPMIGGEQITLRAYCARCRKPRVIRMALDGGRTDSEEEG